MHFEATVGFSYSSDIAIDDVTIYDCGAISMCGVNLLVKLFSKNSTLHKKTLLEIPILEFFYGFSDPSAVGAIGRGGREMGNRQKNVERMFFIWSCGRCEMKGERVCAERE